MRMQSTAMYKYKRVRIKLSFETHDAVKNKAQRERSVEALIALLQAESYKLRIAAIQALSALPDRTAITPLEGIRGTICAQDHPLIDRAISSARKGAGDSGDNKMEKRVEELEGKVKKLIERIEELEADAQHVE